MFGDQSGLSGFRFARGLARILMVCSYLRIVVYDDITSSWSFKYTSLIGFEELEKLGRGGGQGAY